MATLLAISLLLAASPGPADVEVTRWAGPPGTRPGTYREWLTTVPNAPAWHITRLATGGPGCDFRVDIIVEDSLVTPLRPALDTMVADLVLEGYQVGLFAASGTSPESLRAFLQAEYDSGLVSVVLVGDLPVAWFQIINDFQGNGSNDGYEEFPCDLYYMDLNGTWLDTLKRYGTRDSLVSGIDSIFDTHSGPVAPEIGVSRMPVSTLGNADSLLVAYLDRAHRWRTGILQSARRALVYIDDDWYNAAPDWDGNVGALYTDRVSIWDRESTRAVDYRPRIDTSAFESLLLCAHSWPGGHTFYYNQRQNHDYIYAPEIDTLDPDARFYNLFACSNVRFTTNGYCGGRYAFKTTSGLTAIGSAKTGSMLHFGDWYTPLANDHTFNAAFMYWFAMRAVGGFDISEKSWFYGMTLVGDGTLKPRGDSVAIAEQPPRPRPGLSARPNPFRTRPAFNLPGMDRTHSAVYNSSGRRVRTLVPAAAAVQWDGRDETGKLLPAGVYVARARDRDLPVLRLVKID